ncbi:MAG: ABC transporter substrate binding protein [Crocinitomicaceae bacterium]|nr:ABC transporter substrate binding protein [Crocinitomicaceae bacterium]
MKIFYLILLFKFGLCPIWGFSQKTISVGIISDFQASDNRFSALNQLIVDEIEKTVGSKYILTADSSNWLSSNWNAIDAASHYSSLAKRTDLIIAIGVNSLQGCQQSAPFAVPTIGVGVFHPEIQNIPITEQYTSGTENFSYILTGQDIQEQLKTFKEKFQYENLCMLFDNRTSKSLDQQRLKTSIELLEAALECKITITQIDVNDISTSVGNIPQNTDAIYVAVPYEWDEKQAVDIFQQINERSIPTISMNSDYVYTGALLSISERTRLDYIIRKMAIMADDALQGMELGDFNVQTLKKSDVFLNMNTAETIGYSPDFQTMFTSKLIRSKPSSLPTFSIEQIIRKSLDENLDIKIVMKDIELSENDISFAKSQFLPSVNADLAGTIIDPYRPNPLIGQAQRSIFGTGRAQQLLYSEAAIAQIKIRKILLEAQNQATEQEILDQTIRCFQAYFGILQAKTNVAIRKENLGAFHTNLELAEVRFRTGLQNNADVYRWQSEVTKAKQALIEAEAQLIVAKLQLNALLNNSIQGEFDILDATLDDEVFRLFSESNLSRSISSPESFNLLTAFLIDEAKTNYPAKKQLLANLTAVERQVIMNKRLFYTPTIALSGQIDQNFYRGGLGSEPLPGQSFFNTTWNAGVIVSYPLFDQYQRKINLTRSKIQQEQLEYQIQNLDVGLELNVTTNAINVLTSKTQIENSENVAINAEKNYKIVQENYKMGTVNITQLIDAQLSMINAKQTYSLSVFEYMVQFLTLENSVGSYSLLMTPSEKADFQERFEEFKQNYK